MSKICMNSKYSVLEQHLKNLNIKSTNKLNNSSLFNRNCSLLSNSQNTNLSFHETKQLIYTQILHFIAHFHSPLSRFFFSPENYFTSSSSFYKKFVIYLRAYINLLNYSFYLILFFLSLFLIFFFRCLVS